MVLKLCRVNPNGVPALTIMALLIYIVAHLSPCSTVDRVVGLYCMLFYTAVCVFVYVCVFTCL